MMHSATILVPMTTRVPLSRRQKHSEKNAIRLSGLLRSEIGQGTTVTITLPAMRRDPGRVKEEA